MRQTNPSIVRGGGGGQQTFESNTEKTMKQNNMKREEQMQKIHALQVIFFLSLTLSFSDPGRGGGFNRSYHSPPYLTINKYGCCGDVN